MGVPKRSRPRIRPRNKMSTKFVLIFYRKDFDMIIESINALTKKLTGQDGTGSDITESINDLTKKWTGSDDRGETIAEALDVLAQHAEGEVQEHEYNFWGTVANPIQEREDNTSIASAEVPVIWQSIHEATLNSLATVMINIDATALGQGTIEQRLVGIINSGILEIYTNFIDSEYTLGNFLWWYLSGDDSVVLAQARMFDNGTITDLSPYASLCPTQIKVISARRIPALEQTT